MSNNLLLKDNNSFCHFCERNNISEQHMSAQINAILQRRFGQLTRAEDINVNAIKDQGACSFTFMLKRPTSTPIATSSSTRCASTNGDDGSTVVIIQLRPRKFQINWPIAMEVQRIYGSLAPRPLWAEDCSTASKRGRGQEMQCFAMSRVHGVPVSKLLPRRKDLNDEEMGRLEKVMGGMAKFFATGWRAGIERTEMKMQGKVGISMVQRLEMVERDAERLWLGEEAGRLRRTVEEAGLEGLPIALTHGDLLPGNVLVDEEDWEVTGLVDWAEAEWLPFGIGLYGVEHLLGYLDGARRRWVYYEQVDALRELFWKTLEAELGISRTKGLWRAISLARNVGVLLWHGIAWDDGRLDRIVNATSDWEEVAYLEAFLDFNMERPSKL